MILFADADILVIDKPSGLLSVPDGYDPSLPTLRSLLEPQWGRLWVVHRLDKDTSGVMIMARNPATHRALSQQFSQQQIKKTYIALCLGIPTWSHTIVDLPLRVNGDRSHRTVHDPINGKPARTEVFFLQSWQTYTLVEAHPGTGYTHQIRAHLSLAGLPLLGDPLYSYPPSWRGPRLDPTQAPTFPRTALHARSIVFTHPVSSATTIFHAPDPDDFISLIN